MNPIDNDVTLDFNDLYHLKPIILTTETWNVLERTLENLSDKSSKLNKFRLRFIRLY